jgi:2-oxoisovalerate ferredoxin oxidoreductase beta subunit
MTSAFYETFERHAHAEGLKAHSTHYCPGCGHGLVHKYLAEAIADLDVQDRTIAISPVGCSVFMYYYLDVGNTQAAHGRASAVAVGHKLANPDSVVISYQGDGDLAAIGLAEVVHAAQMGIPITVVFVNNGTYGMTGGQLAPTTLLGQKTTTTPEGRPRFLGEPMRVAEMIAVLDGPVYVERVALFDNKQRNRARRAVAKALRMQVENRGFAFVELLAECPVQLGLDAVATEEWVRDEMVPVFPLGVKKDVSADAAWVELGEPDFTPGNLLDRVGAVAEAPERFAAGFPAHLAADDIALKLAGAGGDGAQTAALLLTRAAVNEGFDSTHIPSYGPESRGGTSYADVHIAEREVLSPASPAPHVLVAFNAPSLRKFGPAVQPGGTIVYDSTVIEDVPGLAPGVRALGVPLTEIAVDLGRRMVKNIVALGALQVATELFPEKTFLTAIAQEFGDMATVAELNEAAFGRGVEACRQR